MYNAGPHAYGGYELPGPSNPSAPHPQYARPSDTYSPNPALSPLPPFAQGYPSHPSSHLGGQGQEQGHGHGQLPPPLQQQQSYSGSNTSNYSPAYPQFPYSQLSTPTSQIHTPGISRGPSQLSPHYPSPTHRASPSSTHASGPGPVPGPSVPHSLIGDSWNAGGRLPAPSPDMFMQHRGYSPRPPEGARLTPDSATFKGKERAYVGVNGGAWDEGEPGTPVSARASSLGLPGGGAGGIGGLTGGQAGKATRPGVDRDVTLLQTYLSELISLLPPYCSSTSPDHPGPPPQKPPKYLLARFARLSSQIQTTLAALGPHVTLAPGFDPVVKRTERQKTKAELEMESIRRRRDALLARAREQQAQGQGVPPPPLQTTTVVDGPQARVTRQDVQGMPSANGFYMGAAGWELAFRQFGGISAEPEGIDGMGGVGADTGFPRKFDQQAPQQEDRPDLLVNLPQMNALPPFSPFLGGIPPRHQPSPHPAETHRAVPLPHHGMPLPYLISLPGDSPGSGASPAGGAADGGYDRSGQTGGAGAGAGAGLSNLGANSMPLADYQSLADYAAGMSLPPSQSHPYGHAQADRLNMSWLARGAPALPTLQSQTSGMMDRCHGCGVVTAEWMMGPDGPGSLCVLCGLHYAKLARRRTTMDVVASPGLGDGGDDGAGGESNGVGQGQGNGVGMGSGQGTGAGMGFSVGMALGSFGLGAGGVGGNRDGGNGVMGHGTGNGQGHGNGQSHGLGEFASLDTGGVGTGINVRGNMGMGMLPPDVSSGMAGPGGPPRTVPPPIVATAN